MTRSRLVAKLRTQHWYGLVMRAIEDNGVAYEFEQHVNGRHPILILTKNGLAHRMPVPSSERSRGDHKYLVRQVERFVERAITSAP